MLTLNKYLCYIELDKPTQTLYWYFCATYWIFVVCVVFPKLLVLICSFLFIFLKVRNVSKLILCAEYLMEVIV